MFLRQTSSVNLSAFHDFNQSKSSSGWNMNFLTDDVAPDEWMTVFFSGVMGWQWRVGSWC